MTYINVCIHGLMEVIPKANVSCRPARFFRHIIVQVNDEVIPGLHAQRWSAHHHDACVIATLPSRVTARVSQNIAFKCVVFDQVPAQDEVGRAKVLTGRSHVQGYLELAIVAREGGLGIEERQVVGCAGAASPVIASPAERDAQSDGKSDGDDDECGEAECLQLAVGIVSAARGHLR